MKRNTSWLAVLAVVTVLVTASTFGAVSRYKVTDLGTLPGLANSYVWCGINSQGHVAVYATDSTDPNALTGASSFLWKGPGNIQLLPGLPSADTTVAYGLNDLDQVVGASGPTPTPQAPEGQYLGVLWEKGNTKVLNPLPGDTDSEAWVINRLGLVAGISYDFGVDPFVSSTVCWYKGKILQLPALDKAINSNPTSVNDWGQIVGVSGSRAVLWSIFPKASVIDLGTLGGEVSGANTINNRGQIVGQAQTVGGDLHPALWDRGGITDLGNFGDDPFGCAFTINDCGQIVGFSGADLSDVTTAHALLWETGRMINLQTQIPANSGWVLQQAVGINDQGQINGFGLHNGKIRAFLLTPINEPHH